MGLGRTTRNRKSKQQVLGIASGHPAQRFLGKQFSGTSNACETNLFGQRRVFGQARKGALRRSLGQPRFCRKQSAKKLRRGAGKQR